jgi:hypothetical protein
MDASKTLPASKRLLFHGHGIKDSMQRLWQYFCRERKSIVVLTPWLSNPMEQM